MSSINEVYAVVVGDGCVTKKGVITLHHSIEQKDWALYKAKILEDHGLKITIKECSQMSYGKVRDFIKVTSTKPTKTKRMRELFYPNGDKIIPKEVSDILGFKEWSIIFQDDGRTNKISHYNSVVSGKRIRVDCDPFVNRYEICTDSFDAESISNLRESLMNLNIESNTLTTKNGKTRIVISKAQSKIRFYEGVYPYVIPSMLYKLSAKPTLSYSR